jgi:hypothetical protein
MLSVKGSFLKKARFNIGFASSLDLLNNSFRTIFAVISGIKDDVRAVRMLGQALKLQYVFDIFTF